MRPLCGAHWEQFGWVGVFVVLNMAQSKNTKWVGCSGAFNLANNGSYREGEIENPERVLRAPHASCTPCTAPRASEDATL